MYNFRSLHDVDLSLPGVLRSEACRFYAAQLCSALVLQDISQAITDLAAAGTKNIPEEKSWLAIHDVPTNDQLSHMLHVLRLKCAEQLSVDTLSVADPAIACKATRAYEVRSRHEVCLSLEGVESVSETLWIQNFVSTS